jgi:dCTP deaminase
MLTKSEIKAEISWNSIRIDPTPADSAFNPNSVNLRLGASMLEAVPSEIGVTGLDFEPIDSRDASGLEYRELAWGTDGSYTLEPGKLYLASTLESVWQHYTLAPRIDGRSSGGRLGLFVHITAGYGDVGFSGNWTLELVTVYPLKLWPGQEICQISWERVSHCAEPEFYSGSYAKRLTAAPSKGLGYPK